MSNFFSVLELSDNEDEAPKVVPKKGGKDAVAAPAKKDAAKKDVAPVKKDAAAAPAKKDTTTKPKTEEKPKAKESAAPATKAKEPKVSNTAANADVDREPAGKEDNRGGRGRGKDRFEGRGGRGGRGAGGRGGEGAAEGEVRRPPRHEFDRKSGTGRGREVSRGGRGAFGAGNASQDALEAEKDPKSVTEAVVEGATTAEEEVEEVPVVVAEPEPVTFTLDEFMVKREEARQKLLTAGLVGEGKTRAVNKETEFAGMTTLAKALDDYEVSATKAETKKDQRSTGKTQVLNVGFKFPTPQPEGRDSRDSREGGRGGRGGDRESSGRGGRREGGSGRGAGRGGRGAPASGARPASSGAPSSVFNNTDFPSL